MTPQQAGLLAASKIINGRMNHEMDRKPIRMKPNKKCGQYRLGLYDGILFAWCILALAEHPENNMEQIDKTIGVDWKKL